MKKNTFFYIHSIAGLISGIFIFLLSLSGALLVFHEEIDEQLQQPHEFLSSDYCVSIDSCYKIVQAKYPQALVSSYTIPRSPMQSVILSIYDSSYKNGNEAMQVFIDQNSGIIIQTRGGSGDIKHNFMSWLSAFHNSFHLKKKGEWLLGFFAVMFFISLITGLILYRKNIVAVLLFKKSAWRKSNLHQLIGTWALLFNLMIAITGFWMQRYVFKKEFYG